MRHEIKQINLDSHIFIAKQNSAIAMSFFLIFITLIFSLASLVAVCYRLDAIKSVLGL